MNETFATINLEITPLLDQPYLWLVITCAAFFIGAIALWTRKALIFRIAACALLILTILNISTLSTTAKRTDSVALIVVDESYSNTINDRDKQTQNAANKIVESLAATEGVRAKLIKAPISEDKYHETNLFKAIDKELGDIPPKQRAGIFVITDGNIHDIPQDLTTAEIAEKYGPIHHIVTGAPNERDRRLEITKSPLYGLKGTNAEIEFIVHDTESSALDKNVNVTVKFANGDSKDIFARIGEKQTIYAPIEHAAANPIELYAAPIKGELTLANNRRAVIIQGIRDKLNVLLVSGAPHEGGRYWRSLLTSDPAIELVHFTILRDIDSHDNTPRNQMALIPFPHQQLFHEQLDSFDLIIFDRYRNQGILQDKTYKNIVRYLREGGALLIASGPEYVSDKSIYHTALKDILIGAPDMDVLEQPYIPHRTQLGQTHPITRTLDSDIYDGENWANWLRQIKVKTPPETKTLMSGVNNEPLIMIGDEGDGRIIHLTSDQIWLWARGYKQGGPYIDLMRKMIHWLLKEPSLEEGQIDLKLSGESITITRYINPADEPVKYTDPEGIEHTIKLRPAKDQSYTATVAANKNGLYSFYSGDNRAYIVNGAYDTQEQSFMAQNTNDMSDIVKRSGGKQISSDEIDSIKTTTMNPQYVRNYHSFNTLGLRQSQYNETLNVNYAPLLPAWAYLIGFAAMLCLAWYRESK